MYVTGGGGGDCVTGGGGDAYAGVGVAPGAHAAGMTQVGQQTCCATSYTAYLQTPLASAQNDPNTPQTLPVV